ncbi:dehydrodolichyl diphosphate synthase complex subunit Nus1-like [Pollicipes pollicipes]|uniref:dehydrodolichyl diphosphate synthase complex subunit Nus1-like n=1 Tax=Pollicipes pollicipes TaxID=41117 RepID=UPI001885672A|nr:dehydrodolichyl diphosphate synthase complex subunit Nus1-like [Pollicipes pollicipes]XP_037080177.1 dehydrodolichyl diphosphate synthase complex subunit Nus1-like [Pollicipes pollicipes]XP_037080179.1 dehydrodolichyl diphosphate synthase complex subunit Nus1-like [Pollicipes pollicipes]XP_037080180.1 dehydrodolichyl diphosphate synthase complex subunit Nus1-like [Pollicipes pollicipes]
MAKNNSTGSHPSNPPNTLAKMKEHACKLALWLLHLLASCVMAVCRAGQLARQRLWPAAQTPPLAVMCADARRLQKRPQHLGIILVEPDMCWQTLADIILWSMAYGIEYVSVYERSGRVRESAAAQLRPLLARRQRHLFATTAASVRFVDDGTADGDVGDGCSGAAHRVTVALLWEPDGVADMVAAARRLCGQVAAGARQPGSIDRHMFGDELRAARRWPDPALALKLGSLPALLGYLPWQLRLTEILDAPARRPLTYADFRRLMVTYGGIQQRLGS